MTRVEEQQEAQRAAAEKQEKEAQRADREAKRGDAKRFEQLVNGERVKQASVAQERGAQVARQRGRAESALLARNGIAANRFATTLQQQGQASNAHNRTALAERDTEFRTTKKDGDERNERVEGQRAEQKELQKADDRLAPISRDERDRDRGGHGEGGGGGASQGGQQQGQGQGGPAAMALEQSSSVLGPSRAGHLPQIPPDVLEQLVNRVMVGVTPEGLHTFHIELKDDVLGGASLQVTAENGKIALTVHTEDANMGRLLRASEGELARAFGRKGMRLERFEVNPT